MSDQRRYSRRSYLKVGSAVAGVAALGGCSSGPSSDGDSGTTDNNQDGTTTGGTTSGEQMADQVVFYGSANRPGFFEAFEDKTGIEVNSVTAPGYQSVSRFQTEESNGEHNADILNSVAAVFMRDELLPYFAEIDMWSEFKDVYPTSLQNKVNEVANDEERSKMLPVTTTYFTSAYSTSRVDETLETWDDIIQSKFEGNIGAPTFTMSSMYWILAQERNEEETKQYFQQLADLNTKFAGQATSAFTESVVAGQQDIAFGVADSTAVAPFIEDGAPIAPVETDWTGATISPVAISKNAPHPEAARELVRFMISEEGQRANANYGAGRPSIRSDIDHGNDELGEVFSDMTVYPMFITPATDEEYNQKANEVLPLS